MKAIQHEPKFSNGEKIYYWDGESEFWDEATVISNPYKHRGWFGWFYDIQDNNVSPAEVRKVFSEKDMHKKVSDLKR